MVKCKTVEKTLMILELISNSPDGITLSQIYKQLNMPKATVYDILQTLYSYDAIYYNDPNLKTYVIGSKMFAISQAYTKNSHLINYSKEKLIEHSNKYGLTVAAHKRVEGRSVVIYQYEPQNATINSSGVGESSPLFATPEGKVFLAFLDETTYEKILNDAKETLHYTEKELNDILEEVEKIKKDGYIIDNGQSKGYMCVYAIPVFNFENKMVGVLSALRAKDTETKKDVKMQMSSLLEIGDYVSKKQGYKGDFYERIKL